MARSHGKNKGRKDYPGGFAGIPRTVMDSLDFRNISGSATKLLLELARQFKGNNNGDLTVAYSLLKKRGFNSKETISRATKELLDANLIFQTRTGVFQNPGATCSLFALAWLPINECPGKNLDVSETRTPLRKFSLEHFKSPEPANGPSPASKSGRPRARDSKGRYTSS